MTITDAVLDLGLNVTGYHIGNGSRFDGPVDLSGAHLGQGNVHNVFVDNNPLRRYQVDVEAPNQFSYEFPARNDDDAEDEFAATMRQLPEGTAGRLYRLVDGNDRRQVATWPRQA